MINPVVIPPQSPPRTKKTTYDSNSSQVPVKEVKPPAVNVVGSPSSSPALLQSGTKTSKPLNLPTKPPTKQIPDNPQTFSNSEIPIPPPLPTPPVPPKKNRPPSGQESPVTARSPTSVLSSSPAVSPSASPPVSPRDTGNNGKLSNPAPAMRIKRTVPASVSYPTMPNKSNPPPPPPPIAAPTTMPGRTSSARLQRWAASSPTTSPVTSPSVSPPPSPHTQPPDPQLATSPPKTILGSSRAVSSPQLISPAQLISPPQLVSPTTTLKGSTASSNPVSPSSLSSSPTSAVEVGNKVEVQSINNIHIKIASAKLTVTGKILPYVMCRIISKQTFEDLEGPKESSKESHSFFLPSRDSNTTNPAQALSSANKGAKTWVAKKIQDGTATWDDVLYLYSKFPNSEVMLCNIFDCNITTGDSTLLGYGAINLADLSPRIPKELCLTLKGCEGQLSVVAKYSPPRSEYRVKIKAAPFNEIIEKLTPIDVKFRDWRFIWDFICSYQMFCSSPDLLKVLVSRYESKVPESEKALLQNSVLQFMASWIEAISLEFDNEELHSLINSFIKKCSSNKHLDPQVLNQVKNKLGEARLACGKTRRFVVSEVLHLSPEFFERFIRESNSHNLAANSHNSITRNTPASLLDIGERTIAEQLTLLEFSMMRQIRIREFMKQRWSKKDSEKNAPNLLLCIKHFNHVSLCVSTDIIKQTSKETRMARIGLWIKSLKELNNFNGVMEVMSGLHCAGISRLRRSWALLPHDLMEEFGKLSEFMAPKGNFTLYRDRCKLLPLYLPYLGLMLQDLTFMDDGNSDYIDGDDGVHMVNWLKGSLIGTYVCKFREIIGLAPPTEDLPLDISPEVKPVDYLQIPALEPVQQLILNAEVWEEHDVYRVSKLSEPRTDEEEELGNRFDSKMFSNVSKALLSGEKDSQNLLSSFKLKKKDWALLLAVSRKITVQKGTIIIQQGKPNSLLYFVNSGEVRLTVKGLDSKDKTVGIVTHNHFFGETVLFFPASCVTAASLTDSVDLSAIEVDFLQKSDEHLAARCYQTTAKKMAELFMAICCMDDKNQAKKNAPMYPPSKPPNATKSRFPQNGNAANKQKEEQVQKRRNHNTARNRQTDLPSEIMQDGLEIVFDTPADTTYENSVMADDGSVGVDEGIDADLLIKEKFHVVGTTVVKCTLFEFNVLTPLQAKEKIDISDIAFLQLKNDTELVVSFKNQPTQANVTQMSKFTLKDKQATLDAHDIIKQLSLIKGSVESAARYGSLRTGSPNDAPLDAPSVSPSQPSLDPNSLYQILTEDDWKVLLDGAKTKKFPKNTPIFKQGDTFQRMFQIVKGVCRLEVTLGNKTSVLFFMNSKETFGETSVLHPDKPAVCSVIANEDVDVVVIEWYFISAVIMMNPSFAVRFFKYFAASLAFRIKQTELNSGNMKSSRQPLLSHSAIISFI